MFQVKTSVIIENIHETIAGICNRVHPDCVVCSDSNENGLHLKFMVSDDGSVSAGFECTESLQGYPGILHGGVITTILDGAMGHCMFARGLTAVTVEMTTRFKLPVKTGQGATVHARITRSSHPLYLLEAEIIQGGKVRVTAKSKFYHKQDLQKKN